MQPSTWQTRPGAANKWTKSSAPFTEHKALILADQTRLLSWLTKFQPHGVTWQIMCSMSPCTGSEVSVSAGSRAALKLAVANTSSSVHQQQWAMGTTVSKHSSSSASATRKQSASAAPPPPVQQRQWQSQTPDLAATGRCAMAGSLKPVHEFTNAVLPKHLPVVAQQCHSCIRQLCISLSPWQSFLLLSLTTFLP